jgi:hypothetical protein
MPLLFLAFHVRGEKRWNYDINEERKTERQLGRGGQTFIDMCIEKAVKRNRVQNWGDSCSSDIQM